MKYKGIVFFDSDGTLTDDKENIFVPTPKTVEALDRLKKNGYLPVLCTGRALSYAGTAKYFDAAILSNGSYAIYEDRVVFDDAFEDELLHSMTEFMDSRNIVYVLDNPKLCYCSDKASEDFNNWADRFNISKEIFTDKQEEFSGKVHKLGVLFGNEEQVELMRKLYGDRVCIDLMHGMIYADVYKCGLSKGAGAKRFADYMNIPQENLYAFGDGSNDVSMMRIAAHGIAMGRHSPELDDVCDFVTKTVAEEGICFGLEHYGLI